MKESTKSKLKTAGLIIGAYGGSCAANYACACLAAVCPPVGIPAIIGKFVISSLIAEKAGEHVWRVADVLVESADLTAQTMEEIKKKKAESEVEEITEDEA